MSENTSSTKVTRYTAEDAKQWLQMVEAGKTPHAIHKELGVGYNTVKDRLRKLGWKPQVDDRYEAVMTKLNEHLDGIRSSFLTVLAETEKDIQRRIRSAIVSALNSPPTDHE